MSKSKDYQGTMVQDFISLQLTSNSFQQDEMIPSRYTCDGININPSLSIDNIPEEAKCLAIIVDDPDAPRGTFCHWAVWNIPVTHHIKEKETRGTTGMNDFGYHKYSGPCPPSGVHRYYFNVYALDTTLAIPASSDKQNLEQAMAGHILAFGVLIGHYRRE
jgi:hypothetical protein